MELDQNDLCERIMQWKTELDSASAVFVIEKLGTDFNI